MKKHLLTNFRLFLLLTLGIASFSLKVIAAEEPASDTAAKLEPVSPNFEFSQYRSDDGSRVLIVKLYYVKKLVPNAIKWVDVHFLAGTDLSTELGTARTDVRGIAKYIIPAGADLPMDDKGMITVGARFEGNDQFESAEDQTTVKDIGMKFMISDADSLKIANVKVADNKGNFDKALFDATVTFFVERMFKPLKIGEATLDENGEASVEFPFTLPGDSLGYINLIARIDEDATYGNVQADTVIQWGIPTYHRIPASFRALWTKVAPTWMVITLIILLAGVWGHYSYAIYKLIKIRKAAKK